MLALWSLLSILAVTGVSAATPDEDLKNRPIINSYPNGKIDNDLFSTLQNHAKAPWQWVWPDSSQNVRDSIPRACYDHARRENLDPKDVSVYDLNHDDCGLTHRLCRHKDAKMSVEKVAEHVGRLPAKLRALVQNIFIAPGAESAYYSGNIILYRGDLNLGSLYHEFGHALDDHCPFPDKKKLAHDTQAWIDAFYKDDHVTDEYAKSNQGENFAQITVHSLYDLNVPGGISNLGTQTDGRNNWDLYDDERHAQMQYCKEYLAANNGANCGNVKDDWDFVNKNTGEKVENPYV
ncbi:hypothetical protein A1Q1_07458 [Trichosporon asahii var. asahii CBS 2479]|uniref:Conidiation-specific protein 13 n=1 Tax=Trichosporon asahii var. asahii (strain ATCC 90039 / CBS 2479 / JCM 2466 / KCTC 7840 / NBRC 103889/ NCYC 2677 / UAMH 7654) TaxID=1186058 RepID=J8TZP9_TRIAS|nr:hypothetical protein A1Q1_07458 [Trichosporon asahii var. asahii CBS 2479]EJT53220.1 hypothetical protein A1Q1_07458 [Trichosporon asahii var. asahii CBS 2479]